MKLGHRIATWRQSKGWTQAQLAKKVHLFPPSVSQWEIGETVPTTQNITKLVRALGVSLEQFYGEPPHVENFKAPKRRKAS